MNLINNIEELERYQNSPTRNRSVYNDTQAVISIKPNKLTESEVNKLKQKLNS